MFLGQLQIFAAKSAILLLKPTRNTIVFLEKPPFVGDMAALGPHCSVDQENSLVRHENQQVDGERHTKQALQHFSYCFLRGQ